LYTVFPNAVQAGGDDVKTQPWMVDYGRVTPLIIKSVQDQQQTIEELKQEIELLKKALQQLK
jgi:hypothetical protein